MFLFCIIILFFPVDFYVHLFYCGKGVFKLHLKMWQKYIFRFHTILNGKYQIIFIFNIINVPDAIMQLYFPFIPYIVDFLFNKNLYSSIYSIRKQDGPAFVNFSKALFPLCDSLTYPSNARTPSILKLQGRQKEKRASVLEQSIVKQEKESMFSTCAGRLSAQWMKARECS